MEDENASKGMTNLHAAAAGSGISDRTLDDLDSVLCNRPATRRWVLSALRSGRLGRSNVERMADRLMLAWCIRLGMERHAASEYVSRRRPLEWPSASGGYRRPLEAVTEAPDLGWITIPGISDTGGSR